MYVRVSPEQNIVIGGSELYFHHGDRQSNFLLLPAHSLHPRDLRANESLTWTT